MKKAILPTLVFILALAVFGLILSFNTPVKNKVGTKNSTSTPLPTATLQPTTLSSQGEIERIEKSLRPEVYFITLNTGPDKLVSNIEVNLNSQIFNKEGKSVNPSYLQKGFTVKIILGKPTEGTFEAEQINILEES